MTALGYAVIDFETTGFAAAYGHRVAEVGVVLLDVDGDFQSSWGTLVNPERDLGPTHIHRISGRDAMDAPVFADIAPELLNMLRDRVIVAHNASFDMSFLIAEYQRLGITLPLGQRAAMCTMQLATTFLPGSGRSLAACCDCYGIVSTGAHEALSDAMVTAELLGCYIREDVSARIWTAALASFAGLNWPTMESQEVALKKRTTVAEPKESFLSDQLTKLREIVATPQELDFLALLDEVLDDGLVSVEESQALLEAVTQMNLSAKRFEDLRNLYFKELVAAAWSDGELSDDESAEIRRVGSWMKIAPDDIDRGLSAPALAGAREEGAPDSLNAFAGLQPGDRIVLTGDMKMSRSHYEQLVVSGGYVVWPAVTKKVRLVAAEDEWSLSGKAKRAREFGIPVVQVEQLESFLRGE
jgi:DNA polymerase-3 subunit epsilon